LTPISKNETALKKTFGGFTSQSMEIDTRFPIKLNAVSDAPEPLRGALVESIPSGEPARLLVHAPGFTAGDEKSPATVLAVTSNGWLVASETEEGNAGVEKSDFADTLFLELKSILLLGQLRISFAASGAARSATIKFDTVGDELYREAIDLVLSGIDPALSGAVEKDRTESSAFQTWPLKIRNEAQRFWPQGQQFLAAVEWTAIFDAAQRLLAPAGALLITERELVVISDEEKSPAEPPPETPAVEQAKEELGGIISFIPRARLKDFQVRHDESFDVLTLRVRAAHGEEELEIRFPSNDEKAVAEAMERMSHSRKGAS